MASYKQMRRDTTYPAIPVQFMDRTAIFKTIIGLQSESIKVKLLDMTIKINRPVFALDIEWMHHVPRVISSSTGSTLPCMVKELRYLGVHILQSRIHLNVHYQTTDKHFIAQQMLYLERLVTGCNFAVDKEQMHAYLCMVLMHVL